jgi:hypothetical protein
MLADRLGVGLSADAVAEIAARTGGNPFWALEIGAEIARGRGPGRDLPVPRSLSALVDRRLSTLESAAHEVLLAAALLDQPSIALARKALAPTVRDVDAAIDQAVGAGVVTVAAGRLRAAHPLLSAAIVDALPPLVRAAAHRRLAVLVDDPEQRARHVLRAWDGEPDAKTAAVLEAGSHAAGVRGAVRAAAELAERAAECTPADDVEGRCRRSRIAAEQHLRVADYEHAAGMPSWPGDPTRPDVATRCRFWSRRRGGRRVLRPRSAWWLRSSPTRPWTRTRGPSCWH